MEGVISFVHHDKEYVTIDYTHNDKKKSINGKIDETRQLKMLEAKLIKKLHVFHEGDAVYFTIERSARGDKMVAENIQYRFNNALGNLVNRAHTDNKFVGYLKKVDENYFVKETGSYQFFPLLLSPWELPPDMQKINEPVFFTLENIDKPDKLKARLMRHQFIPEYMVAQKNFNNKTPVTARVYKKTPHAIYLQVIGDKIQAKITLAKFPANAVVLENCKEGDPLKIMITYLGAEKIAVAPL
jgi:hypothetical protein